MPRGIPNELLECRDEVDRLNRIVDNYTRQLDGLELLGSRSDLPTPLPGRAYDGGPLYNLRQICKRIEEAEEKVARLTIEVTDWANECSHHIDQIQRLQYGGEVPTLKKNAWELRVIRPLRRLATYLEKRVRGYDYLQYDADLYMRRRSWP